jgi:hypothetical protein
MAAITSQTIALGVRRRGRSELDLMGSEVIAGSFQRELLDATHSDLP